MGTTLSTAREVVAVVAMDAWNDATYRTIVAILLAVPFVTVGMSKLADRFRERRRERSMIRDKGLSPLFGSSRAATSRSLMTGSMPASLGDSPSPSRPSRRRKSPTIVVHGSAKAPALRGLPLSPIEEENQGCGGESPFNEKDSVEKPPVMVQLLDGDSPESSIHSSPRSRGSNDTSGNSSWLMSADESLEVKLLSPEDLHQDVVNNHDLDLPSLPPPKDITINVENGQEGAKTGTPVSLPAPITVVPTPPATTTTTRARPIAPIQSNNAGKGDPKEDDDGTIQYLDRCSKRMVAKAEKAEHKDKVGIGKAVYDLALIVYKRGFHDKAYKMFKRAAIVQERALKETVYSLAWSMRERGLDHSRRGEEGLAQTYLGLATKLVDQPDHNSLKEAWNTHNGYIRVGNDDNGETMQHDRRTMKGTDRLERRLKRARAECIPLALSRKQQFECKVKMKQKDKRAREAVGVQHQ